jgi:hypothetical protein
MVVGRGTHSHVLQCWAAVTPLSLCALKERTLRANVTLQLEACGMRKRLCGVSKEK